MMRTHEFSGSRSFTFSDCWIKYQCWSTDTWIRFHVAHTQEIFTAIGRMRERVDSGSRSTCEPWRWFGIFFRILGWRNLIKERYWWWKISFIFISFVVNYATGHFALAGKSQSWIASFQCRLFRHLKGTGRPPLHT